MSDDSDRFGPVIIGTICYLTLTGTLIWVLGTPGEDFASYRNAVLAVSEGHSPYEFAAVEAYGNPNADKPVHPFIYPPSSLVFFAWLLVVPAAFQWPVFLTAVSLTALICYGVWAYRAMQLGPAATWAVTGLFLFSSTGLANQVQGQVNWAVAALCFAGLLAGEGARRELRDLAGVLIGAGVALKVSPGLIVVWWLLRRRWRTAGIAVGTAAGLQLLVLPWVELTAFVDYWLVQVPQISKGVIPHLTVRLDIFGNAGPAQWLHRAFDTELAQNLHAPWRIGLPLAALWAATRKVVHPIQRDAQPVLLVAAATLSPAYIFEHHLITMIPLAALLVHAWWEKILPRSWGLALFPAIAFLSFPTSVLSDLETTWWVVTLCGFDDLTLLFLLIAGFVLAVRPPVTRAA